MNKLVLLALVALLACGALWFLLGQGGAGRGTVPNVSAPASGSETPPRVIELAPAAPPQAERAEAGHTAVPAVSALALEHQTFDLEHARWVDVTVVLPAGAPLEDRPALLAFTPRDGKAYDDWSAERIGQALDLSDDFAAELESEQHWSRRPVAAHVRMPFAPEGEEGMLFVQSRYLHLEPLKIALPAPDGVTIAPELGGYVTGHCTFPSARRAALEDISIEFDGRPRTGGSMALAPGDSRHARVRADLSFELRALSAREQYVVQGKAKGFVGTFELSFEIGAGERRELELAFRPGATLAGVVRGDGQPLGEAQVHARVRGAQPWNDGLEAESQADGTFVIEGVPPGKVTLQAEKDGWRESAEVALEVREEQRVDGLALELAAGERISGTVLWPDGTPVEAAEVRASKLEQRWMQTLVTVASAADGSFTLGGLEAGPVEVFARHAARGAAQLTGALPTREHAEATREAPEDLDVGDDSDADQWVALAPAVASGTQALVLRLQQPLPVRGVVVDDVGGAVRSFRVAARPARRPQNAPEDLQRAFEAEDGAFELAVGLPGEWLFRAQSEDSEREGEEVALDVPQGALVLRLVLPRASAISGVVLDPAGRPLAGASVHVSDSPQEAGFGNFGGGDTESGAGGRFALEHVTSGSYVHATHPDWASSELLALELVPGEARADLELHLRAGARVTGEVLDEQGKPQAGQNVNCADGAMAAMAFGFGAERSSTTDARGHFVIEHVTPGKITVSAMPSQDELMQQFQDGADEQAFLALLGQTRSLTLEVADGAEVHVVLGAKPRQPVRVHGRVSEAGAPVGGKAVFAFAEGGALLQGMKLGRSDDGGGYELQLDRPGAYVFGVSQDDGLNSAGTQFYVDVPEVAEFEQNLALPLGRLSGVLLGPDGPAAGVALQLVASEGMLGLDDLAESRRASSGDDGAFAFQHLTPGVYSLQVGSDLDGGAGDPHLAQTVVDGLRVEKDGALEGLVVHLVAPGKLSGIVRDSAGVPQGGLAIFVRDAAGRALSTSSTLSDAAGRFTYEGIAPGRVTASARGTKLVSAESDAVELRAGETSTVQLTVSEGAELVVSVLEEDRTVRARLRVTDEAGRRVDDLLSMDDVMSLMSDGFSSRERRVGPLAPGKYTVVATTLDGKEARGVVRVEGGQAERDVKLRVK